MLDDFLIELDQLWVPLGEEPYPLHLIGSMALFLQSNYRRGTKDNDILEVSSMSQNLTKQLQKIGGQGSRLAKKHRLYLDIVGSGIPFLPHPPIFHDIEPINAKLKNFSIKALDITDVVISKLKIFRAQDVEDISRMVSMGMIDNEKLVSRFLSAMDRWSIDARAYDLPQYLENLHTVQRDMLFVEEVKVELPRWISE